MAVPTNTPSAKPISPSKYCKGCFYVLDGCTGEYCPECGRPFDPNQPSTFLREPRPQWRQGWRWEVAASFACFALALLSDPRWYVRGVPLEPLPYAPSIVAMCFGVGFGISGLRRGNAVSRILSLAALMLNVLLCSVIGP